MKNLILELNNNINETVTKEINFDNFDEDNDQISLPKYIEQNSDYIKRKYNNLINNLPQFQYKNKKLIDNFSFDENKNFFWISDIYEKSIYKNPKLIDQFELIALEKLFDDLKPQKVLINISGQLLKESLKKLCKYKGIEFHIKNKKINFANLKNNIFILIFMSLIKFIIFIINRISFGKSINWNYLRKQKIQNLFINYSAYTEINQSKNFNSEFWKEMIKDKELMKNTLWLNIYSMNKKFSYRNFLKYQSFINKNNDYYIYSLEQLLNLKNFIKILICWFKNCYSYFLVSKQIKYYLSLNKFDYLDKFILNDFKISFLGVDSLINFYYFYLFKNLASKELNNKNIFYLFENQSWEKSLVYNFKGKVKTIAVNHASIRYWDLRFSRDEKCEIKVIPDIYAVNGEDSKKKLLDESYPLEKISKVEALRYFHTSAKIYKDQYVSEKNNILLVSDYSDKSNLNLLNAINCIDKANLLDFKFTLKEHPLKSLNIDNYPNIKKTNEDFLELRKKNQIAIVSNTTSAVLDLYLLDYKIISIMDNRSINLSPMRKSKDIIFLNNFKELSKFLKNIKLINEDLINNEFFYLNSDLRLWKKILYEN